MRYAFLRPGYFKVLFIAPSFDGVYRVGLLVYSLSKCHILAAVPSCVGLNPVCDR